MDSDLWLLVQEGLAAVTTRSNVSVPRLLAEMEGSDAWSAHDAVRRAKLREMAQLAITSFFEAEDVLRKADMALRSKGHASAEATREGCARRKAEESAKLVAVRNASVDEVSVEAHAAAERRAAAHATALREAEAAIHDRLARDHGERSAALHAEADAALARALRERVAAAEAAAESERVSAVRAEAAALRRAATEDLAVLAAELERSGVERSALTSASHIAAFAAHERRMADDSHIAADRARHRVARRARLEADSAAQLEREERAALAAAEEADGAALAAARRDEGARLRGAAERAERVAAAADEAMLAEGDEARRAAAVAARRGAKRARAAQVEAAVRAAEASALARVADAAEAAQRLLRRVAASRTAQRLHAAANTLQPRASDARDEGGTLATAVGDATRALDSAASLAQEVATRRFALKEVRRELDVTQRGDALRGELRAWHAWLASGEGGGDENEGDEVS